MVHPYLRRRAGSSPSPTRAPRSRACSGVRSACRSPGAGDAAGDRRGGFTPGEADALRRAMGVEAQGGLGHFEERLIRACASALCGGVRAADLPADPRLRRIRLPRVARRELRAAGVRLGVAEAPRAGGVRRGAHQQPAHGVLRPSQLVQDARRHGVEVRPVDVFASDWTARSSGRGRRAGVAARLRLAKGFSGEAARRLVAAREQGGFADVQALADPRTTRPSRTRLPRRRGALESLAGHRHRAAGAWPASSRPSISSRSRASRRHSAAARAARRRGHRRGLRAHRAHAAPPPAGAVAPAPRRARHGAACRLRELPQGATVRTAASSSPGSGRAARRVSPS